MESLRTRRSQAAPQSQRQGARLAKPGPNAAGMGRKATRVDSKIKKRMSMRYADISAPTELNPPPVPALRRGGDQDSIVRGAATGAGAGFGDLERRRAEEEDERKALERKMLDAEEFDADACA